ncbi:MAG TPA: PEP/pyruvate-binding domain-containing protein [Polyangia bacterium]|jgi:phosphohistidine swiveling domain-containing protein
MSFCVRLDPAAPRDKIGGKARSLLSLDQAGLPVPPALAVTTELFSALRAGAPPLPPSLEEPGALEALEGAARALRQAPWPIGFAPELAAALASLDGRPEARFAVRSSAAIEDRAEALGAGLFLSRLDVPAAEVAAALREVLASALAPGAAAYLARHGRTADSVGFAVLIHLFTAGDAAGTAALDSSHGAPLIDTHHGDAAPARARIADALTRLTALHGPAEIEWVATGREVTFLQLRPYRRPRPPRATSPELLGWRWDAAHNPLPLSPAQAGLVALVDGACDTGLRQKVVGGYLFYRHEPSATANKKAMGQSPSWALLTVQLLAKMRLRRSFDSLEKALEAFLAIYEPLFGVLQPVARAARDALADFLRGRGADAAARLPALLVGVPSAAGERAQLARAYACASDTAARDDARAAYLERFGDESPCWDVAEPTWREAPGLLENRLRTLGQSPAAGDGGTWRAVAEAIRADLPPAEQPRWETLLEAARDAAAAAEDDDAIYARAQARVRESLRLEGERLVARGLLPRPEDVFWLPLELVRALARGESPPPGEDIAGLLAEARRADADARAAPPSLASVEVAGGATGVVRGRSGAGGVCVGRVRLWDTADAPRSGQSLPGGEPEVIVARTILPTELPLISAAALVVETGGALDHVAVQARERGIPAVVGAAGAAAAFRDGDRVIVDGDAGLVARIG